MESLWLTEGRGSRTETYNVKIFRGGKRRNMLRDLDHGQSEGGRKMKDRKFTKVFLGPASRFCNSKCLESLLLKRELHVVLREWSAKLVS